ncbi:MAG: hypothetical protein AB1679_17210 [Actinomycetota bacterium]
MTAPEPASEILTAPGVDLAALEEATRRQLRRAAHPKKRAG